MIEINMIVEIQINSGNSSEVFLKCLFCIIYRFSSAVSPNSAISRHLSVFYTPKLIYIGA